MPTSPDPLVHVGYHKTGTSWLQRDVFGALAGFSRPWTQGVINDAFVTVNDLDFTPDAARAVLENRTAPVEGTVEVLSHERLSGNPHSGGYDSLAIADRLHATYPEAHMLVVVRRQPEMVVSAYKQYVRAGGAERLGRYLDPPHHGRARVPQFSLSYFEYDRLVRAYQDRFGRDAVLVLPYELLGADAVDFVGRIAAFAGVPAPASVPRERRNVGLSRAALGVRRRANFWFTRDALNPAAPFDSKRLANGIRRAVDGVDRRVPKGLRARGDGRLSKTVRAMTDGRYVESNRRLADLAGLDLAALGYEV